MKTRVHILSAATSLFLILTSCEDKFLNLDPLDQATEAIYFKTPSHFKAAANDFYNKMVGIKKIDDSSFFDIVDGGSDLSSSGNDLGRGTNGQPATDIYWRNAYKYIRSNNYLIQKGEEYAGDKAEIKSYVAEAHFFRAWHHFFLLKRYGGIPISTTVADVNDPLLTAARNSRYEVVAQILKDLAIAIDGLPAEANIAVADKGHLSRQAAQSFKARVLLYEATWEKYVKETTDFESGQKKSDQVTAYLTEAASLAKEVFSEGTFQLWNEVDSLSYYYLFVLEDAKSNPKGLTKASNKEFIFKSMYDKDLNRAALNISHSGGGIGPNRKLMDMYLCSDGLPYTHSPLAKGYNKMTDEFENRDARLKSIIKKPGVKYWGWGAGVNGGGADYAKANYTTLFNFPATIPAYYPDLAINSTNSYANRKWVTENPGRETEQESYDYPQIRLAEVYLIYAEAICELGGGKISDADLNLSINQIRKRAYVAPLTNALIAPYSDLSLLGEIRRERALELLGENSRYDDLKRWAIAEQELNKPLLGHVVQTKNGTPTEYATFKNAAGKNIYDPAKYPNGVDAATGALIMDPASNRKFSRKNYLLPIPTDQKLLNPNLVQNPGW
jgi:hypothetical protein